MEKKVFCRKNDKRLRQILLNMGYLLDQDWSDEHLDMGTGIVLTPENRFYVTIDITEPEEYDTYWCYDSEFMFEHFARYYHWNNLTDAQKTEWCGYCMCEGGCNMCTNLNEVYNTMLVRYIKR